jgi:hypothetical protein
MKTFSTDGRIPLCVLREGGESAHPDQLSPEEHAWNADNAEATALDAAHARFVTLPGREPVDLEAVSDLWLD